jgi:hypothetical protein
MYIGQFESVECAYQFTHGLTIFLSIFVLFILNTVILFAVFIATWRQLPTAARAIPVPFIRPVAQPVIDNALCVLQQEPNPVDFEYVPLRDLLPISVIAVNKDASDEEKAAAKSTSSVVDDVSSATTLRRMELEVTKHFLFTFIPLAVVIIPCLILGYFILVNLYYHQTEPISPYLLPYLPYLNLLPSVHVFIYPVTNLFLNKEISFSCCCVFSCWRFCYTQNINTFKPSQQNNAFKIDPNNLYK